MIAEGGALHRDDVNDFRVQGSNILKAFKEEEYWKAASSWADSMGIEYHGDVGLLKQFFENNKAYAEAANRSSQLMSAYLGSGLNTLKDIDVYLASLMPNVRKEEIGSISNPAYTVRDVADGIIRNYNNGLSDVQRKEVAGLFEFLSTMDTKEGGLLSLYEQKGIDTKHIVDAFSLSKNSKFGSGLHKIFADDGKRKIKGVEEEESLDIYK